MVNKKKNYEYSQITTNIRKIYHEQIKGMNINITDFLDEAISRNLDVINKSDEWTHKEIDSHQRAIDNLKTLLIEKANERDKLKIKEQQYKKFWNNFQEYLKGNKTFKTEFINNECNTNLPKGSLKEFRVLQERYKNGEFGFEEFKKELLES